MAWVFSSAFAFLSDGFVSPFAFSASRAFFAFSRSLELSPHLSRAT